MSSTGATQTKSPKRPWREPTLLRHQSLMAVTRSPLSPEMLEAVMTASMVMMQIGGSQGFFVAPGGSANPDPNAPPVEGYSGW